MTYSVAVFAYDGCFISGIAGPLDVYSIANTHHRVLEGDDASPLFSWKLYSQDGKPVKTSTGILMPVDGHINDLQKSDICVIPGMDHVYGNEVVEYARRLNKNIGGWLRRLHLENTTLAANCSGAFILAEAGLLNKKEATTSWWLAHHFKNNYPLVKLKLNKLVTEDDNVFCSGAVTAYLHQAISIIEKFTGQEIANRCAKTLLLHTRDASQAPYIPLSTRIDKMDSVVHQAIVWMTDNLNKDTNLDELASHLAVSPRTFIRRFNQSTGKPPKKYLQQLRINEAKRLLENSDLSIDDITNRVGYTDVSSFRRLFKREVDLSPTEYRKHFSSMEY